MGTHTRASYYVDARKHRRYKVVKEGEIHISNRFVAPVTITELSVGGARLWLKDTVLLPSAFHLLIKAEQLLIPVEIRWRRTDELGVEFTGEPQLATSSDRPTQPT